MVKLRAPINSQEAHGTIADVLTFVTQKGRATAKLYARPKQPRTDKQVAIRSLIKFLAQQWRNLSPADQATWQAAADRNQVAPYHVFVATNAIRWAHFRPPAKQDPATETPPAPNFPQVTAFHWKGYARIRIWPPSGAPAWGVALFRSQTPGFTTSQHDNRYVQLHDTPTNLYIDDRDVTTGTYYYRARHFGTTGTLSLASSQRTVVIP